MPTENQDVLLYQSPDGQVQLDVQLDHDTVWLTQAQLAALFETTEQNVSLHMRSLFAEQELDEKAVVRESRTTAADGKSYRTRHYNLDVIISVGYRVKIPARHQLSAVGYPGAAPVPCAGLRAE